MKKIGIVLLAFVVALALLGCPSQPPPATPAPAAAVAPTSYSVDVNSLPLKRNAKAFAKNLDDLLITFPQFPIDVTQFSRVTINAKYFDAAGKEIAQGDNQVQVTLIYDPKGDIRGPESQAGTNTPLKQFNVGGAAGAVSGAAGARVKLTQQPGAILFQNMNTNVKFIEVTEISFHN
jgi:hypothetical protein